MLFTVCISIFTLSNTNTLYFNGKLEYQITHFIEKNPFLPYQMTHKFYTLYVLDGEIRISNYKLQITHFIDFHLSNDQ